MASFYRVLRCIVLMVTSRLLNRHFAFAIACVCVLGAKLMHVYAHLDALPASKVLYWGASFFAQDTVALLLLRILIDEPSFLPSSLAWLFQVPARILSTVSVAYILACALLSMSFFVMAGSELQWRNVAVAGDSSTWSTMLTGLFTSSIVLLAILVMAGALQTAFDVLAATALGVLSWPVQQVRSCCIRRNTPKIRYSHLRKDDTEGQVTEDEYKGSSDDEDSEEFCLHVPASWRVNSTSSSLTYVAVAVSLVLQVMTTVFRPAEGSLMFMSWTLPLMPLADYARSGPSLSSLLSSSVAINVALENVTALADPISLKWLPKYAGGEGDPPVLDGFQDWYEAGKNHYSAAQDPLKLSNLESDVLSELAGKLADVDIRHVMVVFLESTRKDVFPVKKDSYVWERLARSFKNNTLPEAAQDKLARLTPNANYITGDYDDGFDHDDVKKRRGGININNAYTSSTYTLKSLTGTLCGVAPLVADFNLEKDNHVYQPCLPHIVKALNTLDHSRHLSARSPEEEEGSSVAEEGEKKTEESPEERKKYVGYKWKSSFMQSVTGNYDKQADLMTSLGFTEPDEFIGWHYLKDEQKPLGAIDMEDINYYGMPEEAVEGYIRDFFRTAKEKDERVFLGHLTSTAHHDFGLPAGADSVPLAGNKENEDLSSYLNAVAYVDQWLGKLTGILEDEGVADETLLVVLGDHGLSIVERGTITPYSNPHVGNYHVPLVLSHPKLPSINLEDAVLSSQVLPTILDLLVETGSLSDAGATAATDLVHNYEGQSLIRPLLKFSEESGQGGWQFTVMNPAAPRSWSATLGSPAGGCQVPVFGYYEWRFTDLNKDPHENKAVLSYDFDTFLTAVQDDHGDDASKWTEEAAVVSQWWAKENHKRWRYEA